MTAARRLTGVLGLAGLAIASYLTVVHYAGVEPACGITSGCHTVQQSEYATLAGIPVALLGLVGYAAILGTLAVRTEAARLARLALTATGAAYSAYLTYVELFVIDAICQWCVASALIMAALLIVAAIDFVHPRDDRYSSFADTPVS